LPLPHDPGPHWGEVGIHGLHRQREWDAVVTVVAPAVAGDELWFVALEDGRVVVEEGAGEAETLARALDRPPPYRAHAVRRDERVWAVAVRGIETVVLDRDPGGTFVELAWDGAERSVRIDDAPTLGGVPELERLAAERHAAYVVTASRLVGDVWEVGVTPL
jgi:YD repeat-containing protein